MEKLIERFLKYVQIDTQSSETAGTSPSTAKQRDLASLLADELRSAGASVTYDEKNCYVYACVPGSAPAIGFISHMDTSPDASGSHVKPRIIRSYDGKDKLLDPAVFPELENHIGEDLIATDGTTLLGADDKAGVAEIMNLADYFLSHPDIPHHEIRIAFTPDEEVGSGVAHFDADLFGAKQAYTVDGGKLGIVEYENFNAAGAVVTIHGKSVHPGSAKNIMINAARLACEFQSMLPPAEVPEHTEGREGFYFLSHISGDVEQARLEYIIRDHDRAKFEARKQEMKRIIDFLNARYGDGVFELSVHDQYYNMIEVVRDHMDLVDRAMEAYRKVGAVPTSEPIRGGTDGAMLSFRGIPCPNLSTGGYNYHGRYEYASIPEMEKSAEALIEIAKL